MRLVCDKCVVRDWSRGDRESLLRYANNRNVWRNLKHVFPHPYTERDAEQWFELLDGKLEPTDWAIEVDGMAVGGMGIRLKQGIHVKCADFGYWLGEPYWGRGIMTEAANAVARYAMDRHKLVRIEAAVFAWNPASMRVLEKCGFAREGVMRASAFKDGEIVDQALYARVDATYAHR